jgi:hypothetical protein
MKRERKLCLRSLPIPAWVWGKSPSRTGVDHVIRFRLRPGGDPELSPTSTYTNLIRLTVWITSFLMCDHSNRKPQDCMRHLTYPNEATRGAYVTSNSGVPVKGWLLSSR